MLQWRNSKCKASNKQELLEVPEWEGWLVPPVSQNNDIKHFIGNCISGKVQPLPHLEETTIVYESYILLSTTHDTTHHTRNQHLEQVLELLQLNIPLMVVCWGIILVPVLRISSLCTNTKLSHVAMLQDDNIFSNSDFYSYYWYNALLSVHEIRGHHTCNRK